MSLFVGSNDPGKGLKTRREVLIACRRRLEQLAVQDDAALDAYYRGGASVPLFAIVHS